MPPASLSTLAVMIPGPTTASTATMRAQRDLNSGRTPVGGAGCAGASAMEDLFQHVVHGHHAEDLPVLLHGEGKEVVLRRQLRDVAGGIVRRKPRGVLVHERVH